MKLKEVSAGVLVIVLFALVVSLASANPVPGGACCLSDGTCLLVSEQDCAAMGGLYLGTDCVPNPCQPGACCFPDGSCIVMLQSQCDQSHYVWMGDLPCSPNPCVPCFVRCGGVCCMADGSCEVITEGECYTSQGLWMPDSWVCQPDPCATSGAPEPRFERQSWGRIKALYKV